VSVPEHPPIPILTVLDEVVSQVRLSDRLSDALDATPEDTVNVEVKWFSKLRQYQVSLRLDAATLEADRG